ncbi:MAG TPA: OAM dimerization domain-containing protein [Thermotogota bacterium]|nr:OAM dimerization domain-containing protein [Thermotogota bacterium]HRW91409.1 OAM dimerization domain-containing protein [Thermotogota bacterium]
MKINLNPKLQLDPQHVSSYGDATNDGAVQLSFTLPVPFGGVAKEAARRFVMNMGFQKAEVVSMEDLGEGFSFFVVFGHTSLGVDISNIHVVELDFQHMEREEVDRFIQQGIGRKVVVVGATIESDAHTVGLDAILNMKGYHGDYGLERYQMFDVVNMGSQVSCEDLIATVKEVHADAILVSQIVSQRNIHIQNLTRLMEMMEHEKVRDNVVAVVGGPRIGHELAIELGYDAGFGPGTVPSQVASFLVLKLVERKERDRK